MKRKREKTVVTVRNRSARSAVPASAADVLQLSFRAGLRDNAEMHQATPGEADILALVEPRFGSADGARLWFENEPLPGFGGQTARQIVRAGRSLEVRDYIAAVDAGIHS